MESNIIKMKSKVGLSISNGRVVITIRTKNRIIECQVDGYERMSRLLSQEHGIISTTKEIIKE